MEGGLRLAAGSALTVAGVVLLLVGIGCNTLLSFRGVSRERASPGSAAESARPDPLRRPE